MCVCVFMYCDTHSKNALQVTMNRKSANSIFICGFICLAKLSRTNVRTYGEFQMIYCVQALKMAAAAPAAAVSPAVLDFDLYGCYECNVNFQPPIFP